MSDPELIWFFQVPLAVHRIINWTMLREHDNRNMLIHDGLVFHNVCELPPAPGGGRWLRRFPASVCDDPELNQAARVLARQATGCEIRLRSSRPVRLFLSSSEHAVLCVYRGEQQHTTQAIRLEPGRIHQVQLDMPAAQHRMQDGLFGGQRFAEDLWRIACRGGTVIYHGIDKLGAEVITPSADDQPKTRWLAYGSSITMANQTFDGYVPVCGLELGWDARNMGLSGSCHAEASIADFFATDTNWDVASFELGINMLGAFDEQGFRIRAHDFIATILKAQPGKPILLISVPRSVCDGIRTMDAGAERAFAFRRILRELRDELDDGRLHYLDGLDWVPDFFGYQSDMVHPEPLGYQRMALRLAEELRKITE